MGDNIENSQVSLVSVASEHNEHFNSSETPDIQPPKRSFFNFINFKRKLNKPNPLAIKKRRVGVAGPSVVSVSQNVAFPEIKHPPKTKKTFKWMIKRNNGNSTFANGHSLQAKTKLNGNSLPVTVEQQETPAHDDSKKKFSWKKFLPNWPSLFKSEAQKSDFKLTRRNSSDKFAHLSFLTPALILHPLINGSDSVTKGFSDKLEGDFQLNLAAAHINDAINGRGRFGEARALFQPLNIRRCFQVISSKWWAGLVYLIIAIHCLMLLWEQPVQPVSVGQRWITNIHPAVLAADAVCLLIYIVDIALHFLFLTWTHIWSAKENMWLRVEFVFTVFFVIDFIILVAEVVTQLRLVCPFRCLRASMLLCKSKNVAHIFNVLLSIISKLGKVFLIITIFIVTFAAIGLHVFMLDYHDLINVCSNSTSYSWNCTDVYDGAFDQVAIAAMHMFVLMSTENYPEFIIPAFVNNWVSFFYFGLYLYAGVFFLTAILLAIIVESYWDYSKRHVKQERKQQREELAKAWNLLDPLGQGQLSVDDPQLLKLFKILKPKNKQDENLELINYMSMYGDGLIDSYDWTTKAIETLSFEFQEEPIPKPLKNPAKLFFWDRLQKICQKLMHARATSVSILVLILLHSILFCLMWKGIDDNTQLAMQSARTSIVLIFVLEVILRLIADGKSLLNLFDVLDMSLVICALIGCIAWYSLWFTNQRTPSVNLGGCVVVSGLSILFRAVFNSQHARTAVAVLRNIYPVMFDLILLVITIIFIYAVLGLEMFQDKTLAKSSSHGYEGSYVEYGCGVGFETFGCSLLIVFQIVTTNDWQEIMLGAFYDAGWPYVFYFLSCYLIVDMIVMNLFVAISIEAYKKLARDNTSLYSGMETIQSDDKVDINNEKPPKESFTTAARNTLSEIFATSRKPKDCDGTSTLTGFASSPYAVRRGTLGSLGPRTPTPSTRMERTASNASTIRSNRSNSPYRELRSDTEEGMKRNSPVPVADPKHRSMEERQKMLKQRGEKVRKKRRRTKQEEKKLMTESKQEVQQLQMDDIVRLKRAVRVIKAFHARNADEMNLREGDVVDISEKNNDMLRGPNGWFPANHVVQMAKASDGGKMDKGIINERTQEKDDLKQPRVKSHMDSPVEVRKPQPLSPGPPRQHRISQSRMIRRMDGAGWRREIHGEMTVMNKDELHDLSKMFRGGLERRHTSHLRSVPTQLALRVNEQLNEEDEVEEDTTLPQVTVSEVKLESEVAGKRNEEKHEEATITSDTNTLTLSVPSPSRRQVRKKLKQNGDGGIPEWMQKFVSEKEIDLKKDVKLEDSFSSTPSSEDERELAFSKILVEDEKALPNIAETSVVIN
ncbi:uncharacterized protein LOC143444284 [Clavelina lepadiformis]|uniref:uncharacterized protein LOC143444284 n=1 Tax=Clavelina lepadiformis TaxID=159417 RepID=UPI00404121AF